MPCSRSVLYLVCRCWFLPFVFPARLVFVGGCGVGALTAFLFIPSRFWSSFVPLCDFVVNLRFSICPYCSVLVYLPFFFALQFPMISLLTFSD